MEVLNWSSPGEIKELHCGAKTPTVQCAMMHCSMEYLCDAVWTGYPEELQ